MLGVFLFVLTFTNHFFFLTDLISPIFLCEFFIEMILYEWRPIHTYILTNCFIVKTIPVNNFYQAIFSCVLITFKRAKSEMISIGFLCCNQTRVTRRITTIDTIICFLTGIETFSYAHMGLCIPHHGGYTTIESIEISKPIPIIVAIDIFYYSSFYCIHILHASFSSKYRGLFTTNTTSTVPDNFSSIGHFFIMFHKLRNLTKVYCSCRNCSFEVSKSIFIVIPHIKNQVLVWLIFINNFFKLIWSDFFSIFLNLFSRNLGSHSYYFVSNFHTHSSKFMTRDRGRFDINIWYIFKIRGRFKKLTIRPTLSLITGDSWANTFCSYIYSTSKTKISRHIEVYLCNRVEFTFWNINKLIKGKKCIAGLMPSIELRNHTYLQVRNKKHTIAIMCFGLSWKKYKMQMNIWTHMRNDGYSEFTQRFVLSFRSSYRNRSWQRGCSRKSSKFRNMRLNLRDSFTRSLNRIRCFLYLFYFLLSYITYVVDNFRSLINSLIRLFYNSSNSIDSSWCVFYLKKSIGRIIYSLFPLTNRGIYMFYSYRLSETISQVWCKKNSKHIEYYYKDKTCNNFTQHIKRREIKN